MANRIIGVTYQLTAILSSSRSMKNVFWNLIGSIWAGALIVLATPWYVSRLGLEGYGLLGLWLMMQVMMGLLDLGLGATLIREFADSRSGLNGLAFKRDLLRTLESVYWMVALLLTLALVLTAGWLAAHWLHVHSLPSPYVGKAIQVMAIAIGLQFPGALYSNGLAGLQEQGRMNALQILGNGLRYGSGIAVLAWRADLVWFFEVQALVAAIQTFATRRMVQEMISVPGAHRPVFRLEIFRRFWRFSTGMALTAVSSALLANADRIVLSKMVPAAELGRYAIAFTATGLLQMGVQPFYRAFFPRYAELVSSEDTMGLRDEYFRSCQLVAVVIIPLGVIGWVFAPQIFQAWLGGQDNTIIVVFRWLLMGITCSGLMWLPAAFQQAHGRTGLHVAMLAGAVVLGTPAMIWAIKDFGTVGATAVWVLHGVSGLTLELWLMHRSLLVGELLGWYRTVLAKPLLTSGVLISLSWWLMPQPMNKWVSLGWIGVTGLIVVGTTLFFSFGRGDKKIKPNIANISGER